jgi:23S rRNA (cytidine1920-2'-O)/16S rRNA (cytidine1409-2'-O)-methyltransferase
VPRRRLDAELVRRGLAASTQEADEAVRAGRVTVGGMSAATSATLVNDDVALHLASPAHPFASRGGEKLEAALDRFGVVPRGRRCLDAGASTGGFTDCLLQRGAARVVAVDVGYGQLSWALRNDPRVILLERTNVRHLQPADLPFAAELVVADLSFISLRLVLPALAALASEDAVVIPLVKPQFEAPPDDVEAGGVVRDPAVWRRVLSDVVATAQEAGLGARDAMVSPLRGPAGNVEFLLDLRRGAPASADLDAAVAEAGGLAS